MNRRQHPDGARAQARQLYEAHGSRRAADITGLPRRTINAWARAEGWQRRLATRQPSGQHVAPVAQARSGQAKGPAATWRPLVVLGRLAAELDAELDALAGYRAAGKARDARESAVVAGILVDKALALAKHAGADRGQLDPAASVARIHELLDSIERRAGG